MILFGTQFYGKVDHVPGLFYVVTTFGHIWFVPLIPTGSYLIIDDGVGENGVQIPMSIKSVLMGWLRGICFVAGPILLMVGLLGHQGPHSDPVSMAAYLTFGAVVVGVGIVSYFVISIGRERAVELAIEANLNPAFVHDHFDQLEGKPPREDHSDHSDHSLLDEAVKRWSPKL